jgi:TetR/AcrR family transcriptional repressor of nem operon
MQVLPGDSIGKKRERALTIYASMVGAIVLARAVDDVDLSEEVLKSVLASIAPHDSPSGDNVD